MGGTANVECWKSKRGILVRKKRKRKGKELGWRRGMDIDEWASNEG